jgi:hypothetical protein
MAEFPALVTHIGGVMSKVLRSTFLAVLALLLASTALAAPASGAQPVPCKGTWQATETTVAFIFPFAYQEATVSGNATQLGRFTAHYAAVVNVLNFTATSTTEFVAADGDKLFVEGIGISATPTGDPNSFNIVEQGTITGGTGRFAGATGSYTLNRVIDNNVTSGAFAGTIVLSNGN